MYIGFFPNFNDKDFKALRYQESFFVAWRVLKVPIFDIYPKPY